MSGETIGFEVHHIFPDAVMGKIQRQIDDVMGDSRINKDDYSNRINLFNNQEMADVMQIFYATQSDKMTVAEGFGSAKHKGSENHHPSYNKFIEKSLKGILELNADNDVKKYMILDLHRQVSHALKVGEIGFFGEYWNSPESYASHFSMKLLSIDELAVLGKDKDGNDFYQFNQNAEAINGLNNYSNTYNRTSMVSNEGIVKEDFRKVVANIDLNSKVYDVPYSQITINSIKKALASNSSSDMRRALGQMVYDEADKAHLIVTKTVIKQFQEMADDDPNKEFLADKIVKNPNVPQEIKNEAVKHLSNVSVLQDTIVKNGFGGGFENLAEIQNIKDINLEFAKRLIKEVNFSQRFNIAANVTDFLNHIYDSFIEGWKTGNWDKFRDDIAEYGQEMVLSIVVGYVVIAGLTAMAAAGVVGAKAALIAAAVAGVAATLYGVYELYQKVRDTDFNELIDITKQNFKELFEDNEDWLLKQTNDVIEGLADILTQFDKWGEKNSLAELLKDYKEVLDTKENTKEVFKHLKQVYEADTKFMGTEGDDELTNTTTEGDHILYGGKGNDTLTGNDKMDILIGGEGDDILNGNGGNDILGGNAGNDTLDGGIGNDILIGGDGNDEYKFSSDYGHDTIDDKDGQGKISIDDKALAVGERIKGNVWYNDDKTYTIRAGKLNASDESYILVVSKNGDTANSITIKDWKQGKLGITLEGLDEVEKQKDKDEVVMGHNQGNIISGHKNVNSLAGNDWIFGTREGDKILSGDGSDIVTTGFGDDTIDSGDGNDLIFGGEGEDNIRSGSGDDVIFSSSLMYWSTGLSESMLRKDMLIETSETKPELKTYSNRFGWVVKYDESQSTPYNNSYYAYDSYHHLPFIKAYYNATTDKDRPYNMFFYNTKLATNEGEGYKGADVVYAGAGDDIVAGSSDSDALYGEEGKDVLYGLSGNDILDGGDGHDELVGGNGSDLLLGGNGDDGLIGGLDDDRLYGGAGNDELIGDLTHLTTTNNLPASTPIERFGSDYLDGGDGDDEMFGGLGNDTLIGGKGKDILIGDFKLLPEKHGNDYLDGGEDDDELFGYGGNDTLVGGKGNDFLNGDNRSLKEEHHGQDKLYGGDGNDSLQGDGGDDYLDGGQGDDKLMGDNNYVSDEYHGNDILNGGTGNDNLFGQGGNDTLYGGAGNDYLDSGNGDNDILYGDSGNDTLVGGGRLEGGDGRDYYNVTKKAIVKDSDGNGLLFFEDKRLTGARVIIKSNTLDKPNSLDFSEHGYILNDTSTDRLQEVERGEGYVRYLVGGDNNFVYKNKLTTEGLMSGNLGIEFYVTVYTEDNDKEDDFEGDTDPFATEIQPPFTGFPPFIHPPFIGYPPFVENPDINLPPFTPPKNPPTLSDPLILDLNHNGQIDTIHLSRGVNFDLDGNRFAEQTSWVNGDDGFVVLDLNNNGRIDNGGELFGTDTLIQGTSSKASDGFLALAQYDKNKDGLITADDEVYKHLKIWQDKNQDGISQKDELKTLEEHGIVDIGLKNEGKHQIDENQVRHTHQGKFSQMITTSKTENNETIKTTVLKQGVAETLLFQVNTSNTKWQVNEDDVNISDEIKALPNLLGYGTVKSLHNVLNDDKTGKLKELLNQFTKADFSEQSSIAEQILIYWTGKADEAKGVPVEGRINLQQLGVLKALWGKEQEWRNAGLNRFVEGVLENAYQDTLKSLHAGLLTQTHHKPWVQMIEFKVNDYTYKGVTEKVYQADFSSLIKRLIDFYKKDADDGENLIKELDFTIRHLDINHSQLYNDWLQQFSGFVKETKLDHLTTLLLEKGSASTHNDIITATDQNDVVNAQDGNDIIIGGKGDDELQGGMGSDTYVFSLGDGKDVILNYDENFSKLDTIYFTQDINPSQVQAKREGAHLILQYSSEDSITVKDFFSNNGATDYRIDQIQFANGAIWDTEYLLDKVRQATIGDDKIYGYDNKPDVLEGKEGNDTLYGNAGNDTLDGGVGNDILDGGVGADRLIGGEGDDAYHVDNTQDVIAEEENAGNDSVISSMDYVLPEHIENLTLTNNQKAITAIGNNLNNILTGNTLNNILDGKEGVDTMIGNQGDDTYYVDNTSDIIIETMNEGYDNVIASSNYTLSEHVENLTLTGDAIVATGNDLSNILIGNEKSNRLDGGNGDDTLDGGLGADTMIGGLGNDTYHVDDTLDIVIELPDEGNDTIISHVDYTLAENVEHLILEAGSNATHATGNKLDNQIIGNEADNVIDGGTGADTMSGGDGNDYYIIDNEFDNVFEQLDGGIDTLEQHVDLPFYSLDEFGNTVSSGSYHQLFDNVENLILKGTTTTAFGNNLDNTITLNEHNNFVNALAGNDTIIYQKGGGKDTISSTDSIDSKDSLVIEGYDLSEAHFVRVTNTASSHDMLQIRFKSNPQDTITLLDYFAPTQPMPNTMPNEYGEWVTTMVEQDNRIDEIIFKKGDVVTTLSQSEFETHILAQSNNTPPNVNKYPKPIKSEVGKPLHIQLDKDTIKDVDPYDSELTYKITLASQDTNGNYKPIPEWLSFDPATLTLTGTPPEGAKGNLQFILWGEDTFNYSAGAYVNLVITTPQVNLPTHSSTSEDGTLIQDGKGNDTLKGDGKDTTFVYTGGKDTIIDTGGIDTLVFGNGITFNEVGQYLMMSGNDLVLRVNGSTANQVTLKNYFANGNSIIETIKFETGGEIDYKKIYSLFGKAVPTLVAPTPATEDATPSTPTANSQNNFVGTDKADKLIGTDDNDQLQGLAGADTLNGKAGNDILIGGAGNDTLIGGVGNDLYYFTKGFGKDTLVNTGGGYDNIYFDGISFNQVGSGLTKMGNDLILKVKGTTDELTLKDFFLGGDNADLNISFADGGSISNTQLLNLFGSAKTATHTDSQNFNESLEIALGLMEGFKGLETDNNGGVI